MKISFVKHIIELEIGSPVKLKDRANQKTGEEMKETIENSRTLCNTMFSMEKSAVRFVRVHRSHFLRVPGWNSPLPSQ